MDIICSFQHRELGSNCKMKASSYHILQNYGVSLALKKLKCSRKDDHLTIGMGQNSFESIFEEESAVPVISTKFSSVPGDERILALSNEDGDINLINTILSGDASYLTCIHAHENAIYDICWVPKEFQLVTVSGDQTAVLWDLHTEQKIASFAGHSASVKWVDFRPDDKSVFATGSRDGSIIVWDVRNMHRLPQRPDNIIRNAHALVRNNVPSLKQKRKIYSSLSFNDPSQSVTSVLFQDDNTLVSSGATDGNIKVWDIRKPYTNFKRDPLPKHVFQYSGKGQRKGFSSMTFDSHHLFLYANCFDNVIYRFDCHSFQPFAVSSYMQHINNTFYIRSVLSPDDQYLLSGSSDYHAYIWNVSKSSYPAYRLEGHNAEVTTVAWSKHEMPTIATCADDMKLKIWRVWADTHKDENMFEGENKTLLQLPNAQKTNMLVKENFASQNNVKQEVSHLEQTLPNKTDNLTTGSPLLKWLISPKIKQSMIVQNTTPKIKTLLVSPHSTPSTPNRSETIIFTKGEKRKFNNFKENWQDEKSFYDRLINITPEQLDSNEKHTKRKPTISKALFENNSETFYEHSVTNNCKVDATVNEKLGDLHLMNCSSSVIKENPVSFPLRVHNKNMRKTKTKSSNLQGKAGNISQLQNIKCFFSPTGKTA